MNRLTSAIAAMLILCPAVAVRADATLAELQGDVRVNQGSEFVAASDQMVLKPGDRVMTLQDSSAVIKFDDGCDINAAPNSLITLPEISSCAGGVVLTQNVAPGSVGAIGAGAEASSFNWGRALMVVVPAATAAIIIADHNGNRRPTVSP